MVQKYAKLVIRSIIALRSPPKPCGKEKTVTFYTATVWIPGVRETSNLRLMTFKELFQTQ